MITYLISIVIFLVAVVVHEFAHGWVAYKLGDSTAKYAGRLTLNPIKHIDLYGTIIFPLLLAITTQGRFIFGWAKPVPISFWNLKNPKRDIIWVGLAGPLVNIALAFLLAAVYKLSFIQGSLKMLLDLVIIYNLLLGVFNLLPIPPLDGSRVLIGLLPGSFSKVYMKLEPFGFVILMVFLFSGAIDKIIWPIVYSLINLMGI